MPGPVLPPGAPGVTAGIPPGPNTVFNVCQNALWEINVTAPGEPPDAADMAFTLGKFNQLLDSWNTRKIYIYASQLQIFQLTPGLSPHTIGPQGGNPTFVLPVTASRPVDIANANIILNNVNPVVRSPLNKRDKDWWANQRLQTIPANLPTDYYYRPDWPNGSIFFWPVPNFAYQSELEIETLLIGAATLATVFTFPPGYELAITLTLAELICPGFERQPSPVTVSAASAARQAVAGLNAPPPRVSLNDFRSSAGKPLPTFNYRTGSSES